MTKRRILITLLVLCLCSVSAGAMAATWRDAAVGWVTATTSEGNGRIFVVTSDFGEFWGELPDGTSKYSASEFGNENVRVIFADTYDTPLNEADIVALQSVEILHGMSVDFLDFGDDYVEVRVLEQDGYQAEDARVVRVTRNASTIQLRDINRGDSGYIIYETNADGDMIALDIWLGVG